MAAAPAGRPAGRSAASLQHYNSCSTDPTSPEQPTRAMATFTTTTRATAASWIGAAAAAGGGAAVAAAAYYFAARRQRRKLLADGVVGPRSIEEFRKLAVGDDEGGGLLSPLAKIYFGYVDGYGDTARACREYFAGRIRLLPRILVGDLTDADVSLELFGQRLELPALVAPTAFHVLATLDGEVATARGSGRAGAGYCYNWMLSTRLCRDVVAEDGVKWLHLYMFQERDLVEKAIRTAEATGAFSAILLTCDHPHVRVQGRMLPYFTRLPFPKEILDKPFFPNQADVGYDGMTLRQLLSLKPEDKPPGGTNSSKLSWDDVKWIQSLTKLPVVVKGVLSVDDALKAVEIGCAGIVVSNHGGRQWDGAPPAIEVLPRIVAAVRKTNSAVPVFVDTGVRSSTDIVKAMCLGATGVLLGRPPLWAMACGGSDGLTTMFETLKNDLKSDLMSLGVRSISELNMSHLYPPDRRRIGESML